MSEARDSRQAGLSSNNHEKHQNSQAIHGEKLLTFIDNINPENLGQKSHSQYVKQIERALKNSLLFDSAQFILLIESIKNCKKPCYRRDLLLEVLDLIIFSDDGTFNKILCHTVRQWKELANSIVMLPDLIANFKMLDRFVNFKADFFYSITLMKVFVAIKTLKTFSIEQQWFYLQIIGRIALSGFNQLVWEEITNRAIKEDCEFTRKSIMEIIVIPLNTDKFELFIEPLYIPIFFYLKPRVSSGRLVHSVIGDGITSNEELKYIICNKSILQTNYLHDRNRQNIILFNIFSYLSYVDPSLLIKTLLEITNSWSHGTKVMMRPYEHSRFISCALVIAFRYAFECSKENLAKVATQIQSAMMKGVSNYLNRASYEYRNLAMCLCEIIFPKLHEIIHGRPGNIELAFEVHWSEDYLQIKRLYESEVSKLFPIEDEYKEVREDISENVDLKKAKEDSDNSGEEGEFDCDENSINSVPIYLRDCINGLVENKSPKYVRLCLIKANELIRRNLEVLETPSDSDTIRDYAMELAQILLYIDNEFNLESFDSHRMKALSSLCVASPDLVVKYLLDEFNGSNKSIRLQLDILQAIVASANELSRADSVGVNNNSKDDCKRGKTNKFAKYACLYFYGIVHKLKADISDTILPSTLVSAARSLRNSSSTTTGSSSETMLRRVIKGVGDSDSQLQNSFSKHLPSRSPVYVSIDQTFSSEKSSSSKKGKLSKEGGELPKVEEIGAKTKSTSSAENNNMKMVSETKDEKKDSSYWIDDGQRLMRDGDCGNRNFDDSYLLSRMLFSISLIIKCLNQQPITCKLSNDLLDILAAYRCHPDSGVRKTIISCLTVIRDCTPKVYFEEYLHDKTMCLFGAWLANQSELIQRLRL